MKKFISAFFALLFISLCAVPAFAAIQEDEALLTVNSAAPVTVNAKAYILMDSNTGTVLAAANENEKLYPASVTKIMTLLLVCEAIDAGKLSFDEVMTCSDTAASKGGSQIWLEPGEQMTVDELLKASFVYSANDACTLLGERVAGSEAAFVQLMNTRASELGMKNTHFDNCTGLDDDTTTHLTTAYDISLMARALLKEDYIEKYTTIWMDTLRDGKTQLVNTNKLIRYYQGATGLKTGTTSKAGCCVCATARRDGLGLIAVVLGAGNSNERFSGARALLDYGFANYEIYSPEADTRQLLPVTVTHGTEKSVLPEVSGCPEVLLNKGKSSGVTQRISLSESVEAPVKKGDKLGTVEFLSGESKIAEAELIAASGVEKMTAAKAFARIFKSIGAKK